MSNLFMVLGRYALLVDETVERAERAESDRDEWTKKWYDQWGDTMEARDWARFYKSSYDALSDKYEDGLIEIEMNFVPPTIVEKDGVRYWNTLTPVDSVSLDDDWMEQPLSFVPPDAVDTGF